MTKFNGQVQFGITGFWKIISERTCIFAEVMSFKELGNIGIVQIILKFSKNLVKTEICCSDVVSAKTTKYNLGLLALFKEV